MRHHPHPHPCRVLEFPSSGCPLFCFHFLFLTIDLAQQRSLKLCRGKVFEPASLGGERAAAAASEGGERVTARRHDHSLVSGQVRAGVRSRWPSSIGRLKSPNRRAAPKTGVLASRTMIVSALNPGSFESAFVSRRCGEVSGEPR